MDNAPTLPQLAAIIHGNQANEADIADYIRLVQQEENIEVLKDLLCVSYDYAGVVMSRIVELLPNDAKAHVSLALWKYNNGFDDDAIELLNQARMLAPKDRDILRADLWCSFSQGPNTMRLKCQALLDTFPNDAWAREICEKIYSHQRITGLESPDWNNPWQDLINREWTPKAS